MLLIRDLIALQIIFNYFHEVKRFGDGVVRETKSFMDTFAGSPDTGKTDEILNLLVQIPLVVAFPRSFASSTCLITQSHYSRHFQLLITSQSFVARGLFRQ